MEEYDIQNSHIFNVKIKKSYGVEELSSKDRINSINLLKTIDKMIGSKSDSKISEISLMRVKINFRLSNFSDSLNDCKIGLKKHPKNIELIKMKIVILMVLEKYDKAFIEILKGEKDHSEESELIKFKGNIYERREKYENAIECYEKSIKWNTFGSNDVYHHGLIDCWNCMAYCNIQIGNFKKAVKDSNHALSLNNKCSTSYFNKALAFFNLHMTDQAKKSCKQALKRNENDFHSNVLLIKCYQNKNKYKKIINLVNKLLKTKLGDILRFCQILEYRLQTYIKLKRFKKAIKDINYLIKSADKIQKVENVLNLPSLYCHRSLCLLRIREYKKAIKDANLSIKLNKSDDKSQDNTAYIWKSISNFQLKEYKEALKDIENISYVFSTNFNSDFGIKNFDLMIREIFAITLYKSFVCIENDIIDEVENNFNLFFGLKNDSYKSISVNNIDCMFSLRGLSNLLKMNYKCSVDDFSEAIRINSNEAIYYIQRSVAYYLIEKYDNGLMDSMSAMKLLTDNYLIHYIRACFYMKKNCLNLAIYDFSRSIRLNKRFALCFYKRAFCFNKLGFYKLSISDCNIGLELNPLDSFCFYEKGKSLMMLKKYQEAIEEFNKAINISCKEFSYLQRSICYLRLKEYDKSLKDINLIIKINPEFKLSYLQRGIVNIELRKYIEAIKSLTIFIRFGGKFIEIQTHFNKCFIKLTNDEKQKILLEKSIFHSKQFSSKENDDDDDFNDKILENYRLIFIRFHPKLYFETRLSVGDLTTIFIKSIKKEFNIKKNLTCDYCQKKMTNWKRCSKCKKTFYCSSDCQKKDWIKHKKQCGISSHQLCKVENFE